MSKPLSLCVVLSLLVFATAVLSKPRVPQREVASPNVHVDRVVDIHGSLPRVTGGPVDTTWIADWTFDGAGGACDDSDWTKIDARVLSDNQVYWSGDDSRFDGTGAITGEAAVVSNHNLCWSCPDGYGNEWYQAIRIEYTGESYLSFDYLVDSEAGYDLVRVEVDSACASLTRVDYEADPIQGAAQFRMIEFADSGLNLDGHVESLTLQDFGTTETHCAYIAFFSDLLFSPADGLQGTTIEVGLVVDNIELAGGTTLSEDFEGTASMHPLLSFANIQDDTPFGGWARVFPRVTDNDLCTENTTCAWLFTDYKTPTLATDPSTAYGPGGFVVRNWLDEIIMSPWVSLAGVPDDVEMFLSFREFGGNPFATSKIVRGWTLRGRKPVDNTDSPAPGDSIDCPTSWGRPDPQWNSLSTRGWITRNFSIDILRVYLGPPLLPVTSRDLQVRFRITDYQWLGSSPPSPLQVGPGPYIDRVRIGYRVKSGPAFKTLDHGDHHQAQDAFPTEIHPFVSGPGEHHSPTTDRFGHAAFSQAYDVGRSSHGNPTPSPNLITGDSIVIDVFDARGVGGIARVEWYGAIVSGPHAGKAPPPWTVGPNGFFVVSADSVRSRVTNQAVENKWFIDLDDEYFRGGDVLHYFWLAEDVQGDIGSKPEGLSNIPSSVEEAQTLTGGLQEVSFLPTIDWDPGYLARIAAAPHGKLEPTAEELANSSQSNCILYYQSVNGARRSGDANRTSFMYTLDRLGYAGHYDVYDRMGLDKSNQDLGGRATVDQATGYALIIQDTGESTTPALPDGSEIDTKKIDQTGWYRDWLASSGTSEAGTATLWLVGSQLAGVASNNPLLTTDMGVDVVQLDVLPALGANPDVGGQASFTFANGNTTDFGNEQFTVQAACPDFPPYNGLGALGAAVVTHRWKNGAALGDGAIVMNANPTQFWNTIMQVPTWHEIRDSESTPTSPGPEEQLMTQILNGVLLPECIQNPDPTTDVGDEHDQLDNLPKVTALYQNAPNPFNPVTTIRFDLAHDGHVDLRIYDVTGRLVRKLMDEPMTSERHKLVWDGLDDAGVSVSSGIYFYRLETSDFADTHKMVVLR